MCRNSDIASILTAAWVWGMPNKAPKEIADFYGALEEADRENISEKISKTRSMDVPVQLTCAGILLLLTGIMILAAIFGK